MDVKTSEKISEKPSKKREQDLEDPALVLTFKDLNVLGQLCHKNLITFGDLVAALDELARVTVQGHEITLEPKLLARLKSRCLDKEHFPQWLEKIIVLQLHDYAGW